MNIKFIRDVLTILEKNCPSELDSGLKDNKDYCREEKCLQCWDEAIKKQSEEEELSSCEVRVYDWKSNKVAYKKLTKEELNVILRGVTLNFE